MKNIISKADIKYSKHVNRYFIFDGESRMSVHMVFQYVYYARWSWKIMHVFLHIFNYNKIYRMSNLADTVVVFFFLLSTLCSFKYHKASLSCKCSWAEIRNSVLVFLLHIYWFCIFKLNKNLCVFFESFRLAAYKSKCVGHMIAGFLATSELTNEWLATWTLVIVKIIISKDTLWHPISDLFIYI